MSSQPLQVAFLWHQHQPYYKLGERYLLPWARLHATKDYFDIAAIASQFPNIRQTINVVPSLMIQLLDYVNNGAVDDLLELSRRPASALSDEEKVQILRNFFLCNAERMIRPYPRFAELFAKGARHRDDLTGLAEAAQTFSPADWRDLQVWYNLTWVGEMSRGKEPFAAMLAKGRGFTEEEKQKLLDATMKIVQSVIPTYRTMMEQGQIELSVTAFYHPILPILCDSHAALEAMPNATLPEQRIQLREDAQTHLRRAVELFRLHFGADPAGTWPSEGSVSDAAMELVRSAGFAWVATDEGILHNTLGERRRNLDKYFPWLLRTASGPLWMVFRDHELSDAIGFVYSGWNPRDAASDFYHRLVEIRSRIIQERGAAALQDALVPVILDGENCWEYYEANGRPFLESLYRLLSESNEIETVTIGGALASRNHSPERTIGRVYSGSWIGSNFKIWIGHEEDNQAWDLLVAARTELMEARGAITEEAFNEAMEAIYICEGSDWFWWYGDENSAANQDDFDTLFRAHLARVYQLIGQPAPPALSIPIRRASRRPKVQPPTGFITPTVDGKRNPIAEWERAGWFTVAEVGGAMHKAAGLERKIWYGCDESTFYLRYDSATAIAPGQVVRIALSGAHAVTLHIMQGNVGIEAPTDEAGRVSVGGITAAVAEIIEVAIPLKHLNGTVAMLEHVGFVCELYEGGHATERFPHQGVLVLPIHL
ncbi:MAG: hypothetical protein IPM61_02460 [Chlorobi bacterium]|nr:hypothetical protein [Chlorobiota bacterium]MBX7218301.1 hypothetical protein [Candidatus Kapabacteria bacterium]